MNMVSVIAFGQMKYDKSKNLLTGVAIFLTTLLLFVIPTVGKNMIDAQYAMVKEYYPQWHAVYQDVDLQTADELAAHHDIGLFGLRSDVGVLAFENDVWEDQDVAMIYLDEPGMQLYKQELSCGNYPQKENEIAIPYSVLTRMGWDAELGDTVFIPYQVWHSGNLDYVKEKEFVITGLIKEETNGVEPMEMNVVYVSQAFLEAEVPKEETKYRFLFQVEGVDHATTDDVEEVIRKIAELFGIGEDRIGINTAYLGANYVDPAILEIVIGIMVIVVFAGIITIYSIYYVSMMQRVQEFGKLKALGATGRQLRQVVLREGLFVALWAVPLGLLVGTLLSKGVLLLLCAELSGVKSGNVPFLLEVIREQKIDFYHGWIYVMASVIGFFTVYASLLKPMKVAGRVSIVEAMRYDGEEAKQTSKRKNHRNLSVAKLAVNNICRNKKKSILTIASLSVTGIMIMVVATVLSCTSAEVITNEDFNGQYMIEPTIENHNKEHPELAWEELQKNNPLNEKLKEELESLYGVDRVDVFSTVDISGEVFMEDGFGENICGIPEEYAKELEDGIIAGSATYEELKEGENVIIDKSLLYWYPELSLGDRLEVMVHDGEQAYPKELKIIAIGDYRGGILNYNYMIMAKEAADRLVSNNNNRYFCIMAEKDFEEPLYEEIQQLCDADGRLQVAARKTVYELNEASMLMMNGGCLIFLGVLSAICIMNLVNTMINSVHIRKKELGMMQAIGMTDSQLQNLLLIEGMFYTAGTLIFTLGMGSILGYLAFLWAREKQILRIRIFSYPWEVAVVVVVVLVVVQFFLALMLSRSVKKESMIDRIRFHE